MEGNSLDIIEEKSKYCSSSKNVLGKNMHGARLRTKELEAKLQEVENRIKHLNQEQDRYQKNSKFLSSKNKELDLVRENHQKLKQDLIDWKLQSDQAVSQKRREFNDMRKKRNDSIKAAKSALQSKNRVGSMCVKAQRKANEVFIEKVKEHYVEELKNRAKDIAKSAEKERHKRCESRDQLVSKEEEEYFKRLENERKTQEELAKKIEFLEKSEVEISAKMTAEGTKGNYMNCAVISEKSIEKGGEENTTSIV